jgi:uncharacterized protein (TIGR02611 family)
MVFKTAKKIVIFVIGSTVILIGIVMIVAPGPAFIVIPAGLAILATEFVWAKLLLKKMKAGAKGVFEAMGVGGESKAVSPEPISPDESQRPAPPDIPP